MPLIEVKLYDHRLADPAAAPRLIEALTEAAVSELGEKARPHTWVVLTPVPAQHWGIAGVPGTAPDVPA